MNTRNNALEVAEFAMENGIVKAQEDETLYYVYGPMDNGDLKICLKWEKTDGTDGKRDVVIPLDAIRKALNVNAYWEADPYNGGEKFLIVPMD